MKKRKIFFWITGALKGMVIGTGAILPGISGGVLSLALGIYQPVMNFLAHPIRNKRILPQLIPVGVGFLAGVLLLARLVELLFKTQITIAVWLFIGLIVGTLPSIWKDSSRFARTTASFVTLAVSFAALLALLLGISGATGARIVPNTFWWLVCGVLWGLGLVVPGLSPSSLLIYLGLYEPLAAGIASLSLPVIIPLLIGIGVTIFTLAKAIKWVFDKVPSIAYHCIMGVIAASTVVIIPAWQGGWMILYNALALLLGLGIALSMGYIEKKTTPD